MLYSVYVLRSQKDNKRYVGMTKDLNQRMQRHNAGKVISTKSRRPLKLMRVEEFPDAISAHEREKYLKSAAGRRFLKTVDSCEDGGMADTYV